MSFSAARRTPIPNRDIAVSSPEVGNAMRKSNGGKQHNGTCLICFLFSYN